MTDINKAYLFILLLIAPIGVHCVVALLRTMTARRKASEAKQWSLEYHHGASGIVIGFGLGLVIGVAGVIIRLMAG